MLESLNYSFRDPKKHNLSNLPHQTVEKLQKNHGVLRGPQLGKQSWRARLGILRVNLLRTEITPFYAYLSRTSIVATSRSMLHKQELFIVDIHTQQITLCEQSGVLRDIVT